MKSAPPEMAGLFCLWLCAQPIEMAAQPFNEPLRARFRPRGDIVIVGA
jgi:hypothetical protein